ncbi:uncharacterized protein [Eurosta solidaginis]|uniref:uncharacterized protein n=1 Tax=Eurosta solidaginis TaxID=178769 RepID=UPI003530D930
MTKKLTSVYGGIEKHMFLQSKEEKRKMEINKKYARTTTSQFRLYVAYCRDHPELLQGKNCPTSPNQVQSMWEELSSKLNAMVGPSRTCDTWRESLRNWRKQLQVVDKILWQSSLTSSSKR